MLDRALHRPLHRRHFIIGAAGTASLVAAGPHSAWAQKATGQESAKSKPLPDYASWKDADSLIVHSQQTLETRRSAIDAGLITPTQVLFVRNNLPPPEQTTADRNRWTVRVEGVRNPREFSIAELERLGVETVASVLQCSGNGRRFFDHKASGTQWGVGAAGCVLWTGVPVAAVVEACGGLVENARFMTGRGGEDLPSGVDPATIVVERSVPITARENAILAWEFNSEPLAVAHGGPLRLVVPGYFGVNNVKYISRLAFTPDETQAQIQRTGYRVRPVGMKGAPDQPSMWQMPVKSWVTQPLEGAEPGEVVIVGVAFGGTSAVNRVEVSKDGGRTWQEARFVGPDLGRFAWRPFALRTKLEKGEYTLASRATDAEGNRQPEEVPGNERGYGHNGWRDHAAVLSVT